MKKYLILLLVWAITFQMLQAQTVFINEVNHAATNVNDRGIGIAGPAATDLSGWKIVLYDDNGNAYYTESIAPGSSIDNEGGIGYGEIWYPMPTLTDNNGKVTAAIVDATPAVVQMLTFSSISSTVTAVDGAASGTTSQAAPLLQTTGSNALQLTGTGTNYPNFISTIGWTNLVGSTAGDINGNQIFSVLPVELMNFDGQKINHSIQLNWRTATEENNQEFVIERSKDGKRFEPLGNVKGAGTSTLIQSYNYQDSKPLEGWNYYRLKQIDDDGTFSYSEILPIYYNNKNKKSISIHPNPVRRGQSLQIHSSFDENIIVRIMSINGKTIKELMINQANTTIHLPNLSTGIYIYQAIKNGKIVTTNRLIIME